MAAQDFANGRRSALTLDLDPARPRTPNAASSGPRTPTVLRGGIVVFSGGSAANSLVDVFNEVRAVNGTTLSYIIPISDNGGSSSELIRVFGGPGKSTRTRSVMRETNSI